MTKPKIPSPPAGARAAGKALWRSVQSEYELEEHEAALLVEAVRLVDLLADLHAAVESDGALITGPDGSPRVHPAAVEARQSRIALARIIAALRLPSGEDSEGMRRPQRRVGARGVYLLGAGRDGRAS